MRNTSCLVLSAPSTANANSALIDANQLYAASFQASFNGDSSAAGAVKLQASDDPCAFGNLAMDFIPTNWSDVPSATATVVAGATVLIPYTQLAYRWIRVVFTRTGGAGTITVNMNAQSF